MGTRVPLPANAWVDVSLGHDRGTITHNEGITEILFAQAATIPTLTPAGSNPISDKYRPDVGYDHDNIVKPFFGLTASRIWAYSVDSASVITTTEVEG